MERSASKIFNEATASWAKRWCFEGETPSVEYLGKNYATGESEQYRTCRKVKSGEIIDLFSAKVTEGSWEDLIFSRELQNIPKDEVLSHLIEDAKKQYIETLANALSGEAIAVYKNDAYRVPPSILVGDFSLAFRVSINGATLEISVPIYESMSGVRPKTNRSETIRKLDVFLLPNEVQANIQLKLGEFDIGELKDLSEGDVLSSNVPLFQEFTVDINNTVVAQAFLGKQENQKAVLLHKAKK